MSRLSVKIEYDKKVEQLQKLVQEEAIKLQDVIDQRDEILLNIKELSNRKTALGGVIVDLEKRVKEKEEVLNQLMVKESSFVNSVKIEFNKEKSSLEEIKKIKEKAKEELQGLNKVTSELNEFIKKEGNVKQKYLEEEKKLHFTQKENKEKVLEVNEKLKEFERKNKEFDIYKQYLTDLYGRLASYVKVAQESIVYVNEFMIDNEVPMKFDLPPGEIIKIDFNNFNNKRVDT
jgi:chromosome segregation ATPase